MTTRKQERRERKRRVHGIDRGPAPTAAPRRPVEREEKAPARGRGGRAQKRAPFPSWRRALKRSGIFIAGWLAISIVIAVTSKDASKQALSFALGGAMLLLMIPLTYYVDRTVWRSARKRGLPHDPPPPGARP